MRSIQEHRLKLWRPLAALLAAGALGLTACGGSDSVDSPAADQGGNSEPSGDSGSSNAASDDGSGFPVTIDTCFGPVTFDKPPERVVSDYQNITDMLVALGLQKKIVVAAYSKDSPPPTGLEDDYKQVDKKAFVGEDPTKEVVFAAEPDLFVSAAAWLDFGDYGAEGGYPTRQELDSIGTKIFTYHGNCTLKDAETTMTIDDTYDTILDLGKVFGVEPRAQEIVDEMKATVADVQKRVAGKGRPTIFNAYPYPDYIGAYDDNYYNQMVELAGGRNPWDKNAPPSKGYGIQYVQLSREAYASRPLDVITVFHDKNYPLEANLKAMRKDFPNQPAVKNDRLVPFLDTQVYYGVRNAEFVRLMAEALHPEEFKGN